MRRRVLYSFFNKGILGQFEAALIKQKFNRLNFCLEKKKTMCFFLLLLFQTEKKNDVLSVVGVFLNVLPISSGLSERIAPSRNKFFPL